MNISLAKSTGNVRKYWDIKLVTNKKKKSGLISESNYHTKNCSSENLLAIEVKNLKVTMNKTFNLGL